MGNSQLQQFLEEGLQVRNPPSPKLLVSGNMSQQKTTTGSPKSPKSPEDNSKSDSGSSSPSKSGRSPSSIKLSPGSIKSPTLAERLAQSNKAKLNQSLRSPVSKSPPTSPTTLASSKTEVTKESNEIKKLDETEKSKVDNSSVEVKMENTKLSNGQHSIIVENGINESNEIKQDVIVEVNQMEIKDTDDLSEVIVNETDKCNSNDGGSLALDVGLEIKPLRIDNNVIMEQTSKKDIRQKVWEFMEENSLVVFPKPCFNRIPNFKGCNNVSLLLEKLEEFKKAKTVQVTPDKAQETARFLTLNWGKRLLVPLLRLKEGLLQHVSVPFAEPSAKMLRSASTQKGLRKWGNKLITLNQNNEHIDLIILGSVAVDKKGRRIGIGNGFCDLEFVLLSSMNMVTDNTVVVTIVHDVQVFDNLPADIFKPYDVPVDIIITPNEIIRVENRLDRPKDVFWNYISKRRLLEMPPLQSLRTQQEQNSDFDCTLKEEDSEPEEIPPSPKTYKKTNKGFRQKRYSTRSETNDSVFKDNEVSKHGSSKPSSATVLKKAEKHKRAKSTSSQQQRSTSTEKRNNQNDKKELRSSSKKPNKRRTKSESANKTLTSPVTQTESKSSNGTQPDSPSIDTPKNKQRPRPKQSRKRILSDDNDKQSIHQSNNGDSNYNSRSNSRATRRDYKDHQDHGREMSVGHKAHRDYLPSPKKYFSQNYRQNSYSLERQSYHGSNNRSNSRVQRHDSNRSTIMQQNRYSNGPMVRPTRYFNGPIRHDSYNGSDSRQNNGIVHHGVRHNSYSNDTMSRQNSFYDGVISRRNSYSKGPVIRQDNYTNSRVFRPPQYRNGMASQNNERDYLQEPRPHFNNNRIGYFNSNEKPNYSRSSSGDEFVLKVGNIANNVRVRDLKAALMERGVKPLHITWRGPRGFAYLRYSNSSDLNKEDVMGSLQNVRIKPNGVETAQTQTLIVTECQFS